MTDRTYHAPPLISTRSWRFCSRPAPMLAPSALAILT